MSMWRPEVNLEYLPSPPSLLRFEKSLSTLPGTDCSAKLASQEARESSRLCLHETGVTNLYGFWVFYVGSGYQTQVLKLVGQVISQSLEMYFQRVGGHWVWLASFGGGHSFRSRRTPGSSASTLKKSSYSPALSVGPFDRFRSE